MDEGGAQVPATGVDQRESALTIVLEPLGGARYIAEIDKEGSELNGTFSLGGNDIPLKLKKVPAPVHRDYVHDLANTLTEGGAPFRVQRRASARRQTAG